MARYNEYSYDQGIMIPVDFSKQIVPGTLEYSINWIVDNDYPFILSTGRRLSQCHTRTQTGRSGMDVIYKKETADISIHDAEHMGITNGSMIRVKSRRGEINVPARITNEVPRGMVRMTFHCRDGNCNWFTNNASDRITKTPEYKACAVRIEKV